MSAYAGHCDHIHNPANLSDSEPEFSKAGLSRLVKQVESMEQWKVQRDLSSSGSVTHRL